ncbi:LPS translocon maturation chaperone LptM [Agrobacterium sp.]|uniref:LPS translocon maturation chaperone LptM n=1 Tax=Agrobacterium sp. TaxID=361 RepID=UPI0028A7D16B|nr:hypothetical protein [Agrobacterium sp.]
MLSKTVRSFLLPLGMMLAVSLVVTGCGRKGAIDPPSTPVEQRNKRAADGKEVQQVTPERPFVLDPLL